MTKPDNLIDAFTQIDCIRIVQARLGKPIEHRLVTWGLAAIARDSPKSCVRDGWHKLTTDEARWRRVRVHLSADAVRTLARLLHQRYEVVEQQELKL